MKKIKIRKLTWGKLLLVIIIIIQFALIAVLAWYLHNTRQEENLQSTLKISTLINRAVDALTRPLPVDPKTGALYIHQAKLTLPPPPDQSYELYYNYYSSSYTGADQQVTLVDEQNVRMQEAKVFDGLDFKQVFDAVPKLQACARGYQLFFKPQKDLSSAAASVFNKKLNDGRVIYAYLDKGCTDNSNQLTPYIKKIQSY